MDTLLLLLLPLAELTAPMIELTKCFLPLLLSSYFLVSSVCTVRDVFNLKQPMALGRD